jgi:PAS domain S-box-containing protein
MRSTGRRNSETHAEHLRQELERVNSSRLISTSVGREVLSDILNDLLQLCGVSAAVYEKDGDCALKIIRSKWCHFLNDPFQNVCGTEDLKTAVKRDRGDCSESCRQAALSAIKTGRKKEIECLGRIRIRAVPIWAEGKVIGSISLGYGNPPAHPDRLRAIAQRHGVEVTQLQQLASSFEPSQPFLLELAKKRLLSLSRMISEIVKRSLAEEALRRSQHFVHQVIETTPNLLYIYDLVEKRNIYANRQIRTFLGYSPEQLQAMGQPLFQSLFDPNDVPLIEKHHEALSRAGDGDVRVLEYRVRHSSGEWRWLSSHDVVFSRNAEGLATQILGSAQDITDRKRTEEALGESEAFYRALAENLPGIVYRFFPDERRMLFFNDMLQSVTGYTSEELDSQGFCCIEPLILSGDRDEVIDAVKAAVNERKPFEVAYRLRHKNGSIRNCLERGRPIYDEGGGLLHIEGVIFDTTERLRIENQLRQAQKMEAIGTLAGGIAHDFNNILATILTYSQIALRDLPDSSPTHDDLQQVVQATHRAKNLVKQILAFSRQTDKEKKHPLRVGSIIKEAIQLLRASLPSTIEIRQRIMSKEDVALIDPTQIHQVLINLCTNAAHAMHEKGGVLDVTLTKVKLDACDVTSCPDLKSGKYLKLSVGDTGHGMGPDILQQIFDPYFTTKEPGEGTGLGLAVVHGIVKQHDGAIRVHSELGKGSTFDVLFPVIESNPETNLENDMEMPGGTERILLVDDEEALLMGRKRIFEKLGYHVVAKKNSPEALEVFKAQPHLFDLVITDYTMPHMTGVEIAREINSIRPEIPIVLSTGGGAVDILEEAKEAGIREIVTKPLQLCDLARMVRRALDKVRSDDLSGQGLPPSQSR